MARLAGIVLPGYPHHIIQRGNRRRDVFFVGDDSAPSLGSLTVLPCTTAPMFYM